MDDPVEIAAVVKKLPNKPVALAKKPSPHIVHVKKLGSNTNTTTLTIYRTTAIMS
jgi:hypothetical protein